uniref:Histone acetyltransferase KAT6A-like n=1 Tax=Nicotiana tabacum TaxID=4097 RepID=A0A1S4DEB2_TOBAC|nr:PREDICTED: histone acetyltransferase KAT6A-like [Nicotiana tabacum]
MVGGGCVVEIWGQIEVTPPARLESKNIATLLLDELTENLKAYELKRQTMKMDEDSSDEGSDEDDDDERALLAIGEFEEEPDEEAEEQDDEAIGQIRHSNDEATFHPEAVSQEGTSDGPNPSTQGNLTEGTDQRGIDPQTSREPIHELVTQQQNNEGASRENYQAEETKKSNDSFQSATEEEEPVSSETEQVTSGLKSSVVGSIVAKNLETRLVLIGSITGVETVESIYSYPQKKKSSGDKTPGKAESAKKAAAKGKKKVGEISEEIQIEVMDLVLQDQDETKEVEVPTPSAKKRKVSEDGRTWSLNWNDDWLGLKLWNCLQLVRLKMEGSPDREEHWPNGHHNRDQPFSFAKA